MQQVLHIIILHGKIVSFCSMLIGYRLDWSANILCLFICGLVRSHQQSSPVSVCCFGRQTAKASSSKIVRYPK